MQPVPLKPCWGVGAIMPKSADKGYEYDGQRCTFVVVWPNPRPATAPHPGACVCVLAPFSGICIGQPTNPALDSTLCRNDTTKEMLTQLIDKSGNSGD